MLKMSWTRVTSPTWTMITSLANSHNSPKLITSNQMNPQEKVKEIVTRQAALARRERGRRDKVSLDVLKKWNLEEAYDRCVELAARDLTSVITNQPRESSLNLGLSSIIKTLLLFLADKEHLKAVSALAGGQMNLLMEYLTVTPLDSKRYKRVEQRLIDTFHGNPRDICDTALFDTVTKYQVDIQLFKDMIEGMRLDLSKPTYESFNELYLYSYYATGTAVLMCIQVIGFDPQSEVSLEKLYNSIISFAVALQLTDILRDISEDARMGRVYLPQEELRSEGISSEDIKNKRITSAWRNFMKAQIERVKLYYKKGDVFITELKPQERWFFWWLSLLYMEILENIEANDFNFTRKTSVGVAKQLETLILANGKTLAKQIFNIGKYI